MKYWMAQTSAPNMWAIGTGDEEVAHVHDRDLALRITRLLNSDEKAKEQANIPEAHEV